MVCFTCWNIPDPCCDGWPSHSWYFEWQWDKLAKTIARPALEQAGGCRVRSYRPSTNDSIGRSSHFQAVKLVGSPFRSRNETGVPIGIRERFEANTTRQCWSRKCLFTRPASAQKGKPHRFLQWIKRHSLSSSITHGETIIETCIQ